MADERSRAVANHWAHDDVYTTIVSTLARMGKQLDRLTLDDLAPVDHVHARGFVATVELADALPIHAGQQILDIGCGLGVPRVTWRSDSRVA